ncbi:McrC family protein [Salipaludibacillus keqinensis]|nr:McrC family protein [Salipaludibacillus keqinensis]
MKQIVIREAYDWIFCDKNQPKALTQVEWEHLLLFIEERYKNENVVEHGSHRLRFINLVGVIQLDTVRIEILPKIDLNKTKESLNRRALLNMLSMTKKLPIAIGDKTLSTYEKVDLVHIIANLFIVELSKTLNRGMYREYRLTEENIPTLKGRLLVSEPLRKNTRRSVNAFCEFDELTPDILINQLLKAALRIVFPYVQQSSLKMKLMNGFEMLDDVSDVPITSAMLDQVEINRQNQHYETTLQLATAILQSTSMSSGQSKQIAFSYLFKMNDLFEGYTGEMLKKIMASSSYKVWSQHTAKRLLHNVHSGRENILLKPDFVLEDSDGVPKVIIDTKWKSILMDSRVLYKQSDIYQMYAYITAYKEAERCILLYPKTEDGTLPTWLVPDYTPEKYIEVKTVRLDSIEHTGEDLEGMLNLPQGRF